MIRVTVWNENYHEQKKPDVREQYPYGIHNAIGDALKQEQNTKVVTATQDQPEFGLPDDLLENTDVLIWWAHALHQEIPDELAQKIQKQVNKGMGFIALHSAHFSKPFKYLMGTSCSLRWREGDRERVWCVSPGHPIAEKIPSEFELESEEMYGEYFDIPQPDEQVFLGWFSGGELVRAGCCWTRGLGRVFYFQPGHETYPTYHNPIIQQILKNAVVWAAPRNRRDDLSPIHDEISAQERSQKVFDIQRME